MAQVYIPPKKSNAFSEQMIGSALGILPGQAPAQHPPVANAAATPTNLSLYDTPTANGQTPNQTMAQDQAQQQSTVASPQQQPQQNQNDAINRRYSLLQGLMF
jgi:hypothetical protein